MTVPPYWPTAVKRPRGEVRGAVRHLNGVGPLPSRPEEDAGDTGLQVWERSNASTILPHLQAAVESLAVVLADAVVRYLDVRAVHQAERRWLTVQEAAAYARAGRGAIYAAIRSGNLRAHSVGRRLVIERDELDAWIRHRGKE